MLFYCPFFYYFFDSFLSASIAFYSRKSDRNMQISKCVAKTPCFRSTSEINFFKLDYGLSEDRQPKIFVSFWWIFLRKVYKMGGIRSLIQTVCVKKFILIYYLVVYLNFSNISAGAYFFSITSFKRILVKF